MNIFDKIRGTRKDEERVTAAPEPEGNVSPTEDKILFHNLQIFKQYNENKKDFLYSLLTNRKKIIFDLVPYLIHVQAAGLLSADDACRLSPYGVYNFEITPQVANSFEQAFPDRKMVRVHPQSRLDPNLPVKIIGLIGSLGSIAQSAKSDFDYWICVDRTAFDQNAQLYFNEKMRAIERWAAEFADAEVHCFPLSIDAIQADDFGEVDAESSGTAQGKLLKDEFYRSMTLVAGKVPLWWIMPPLITDDEYSRLKELVDRSQIINPNELVDLGNVHDISPGEFYGAVIWQIIKTMGSPFKSVLKMALLEEYLFGQDPKGLLCHELKNRLFSKAEDILLLDHYILMFDRISEYLKKAGRARDLDLLRRALYLKSEVKLSLSDYRRSDLPRKKQIMANKVRDWGWNHHFVDKLNNYQNWSFQEVQKFNQEVNRYVIKTYKNISEEQKRQPAGTDLSISARDMTVLGRKLYIYYSRRANKIDRLVSVIGDPPPLKGVTLQRQAEGRGKIKWYAYQGMLSQESILKGGGAPFILKSAPFLQEILAWLVYNCIYSPETTINLNQGPPESPNHFTVPDIQNMLKALTNFFRPFNRQNISEDTLLKAAKITKMFLTVNTQAPEWSKEVTDTSVCYLNSWGELFFKAFESNQGIYFARDFIRKNFAYDPFGARKNLHVFLPKREFARIVGPKLDKFFGFKVS